MSSGIQPYNPGELSNNLDQLSTGLSQYLVSIPDNIEDRDGKK